jgi:hypothetical protein
MPISRSRILLPAALCAVTAAAAPAAALAKTKPGPLPKLQTVSPLATAMPGARVPVRTVAKGRSARARLSYLLSADRRPSKSDARIGATNLPALRPGTTATATTTVKIPARGKIGSWYLLACVGAGKTPQCSAVPLPVLSNPTPCTVWVPTDATHAASALISAADGGTLTATGADGSTYTLTLPAGALASDETISLTPVSSLRGLGAGTPAAGAQITPDGLALLKPATLVITPAHPVPVARQTGYFWHGTGRESGLYPPNPEPKSFTLTLYHFSGYALVDADRAARTAISNQPTNVQDRYADYVKAVSAARAADDKGPAQAALAKATLALLQTQLDAVVKPALAAAATDDRLAVSAVQTGLTWAHQAQVLGAFDAEARQVLTQVVAILRNALEQSAKRCSTNVAFTERVLYLAHVLAVLGAGDAQSQSDLQKAQKCLQFQLDFTASSTDGGEAQFFADVQLKGLKLSALGATTTNQVNSPTPFSGSVQYTRLGESGGDCSWSFSAPQETEPFTVYRLEIDSTLREVVDAKGHATFQTPAPAVGMEMSPGSYSEPFTVQCPHGGGVSGAQKIFSGSWWLLHQSEVTQQGHYILLGWTPGTDGVLAQKTYDQTLTDGNGVSISQQSTFTIKYATGQ